MENVKGQVNKFPSHVEHFSKIFLWDDNDHVNSFEASPKEKLFLYVKFNFYCKQLFIEIFNPKIFSLKMVGCEQKI